jgi:hypothetical protein
MCTNIYYGMRTTKGHFKILRSNNKCITTDFVGGRCGDVGSCGSWNGSSSSSSSGNGIVLVVVVVVVVVV